MKLGHNLLFRNTPPPHHNLFRTTSYVALSAEPMTERIKLAESLQSETLRILEWPSVCTQLSAFTSTSMGLKAAQSASVPLGRTPGESRRLLDQTSAAVAISRPLDFSGIEDVSPIVEASVSGGMLSIGELCSVRRMLRSARSLTEQLEEISAESNSRERCAVIACILFHLEFPQFAL